MRRRTTAGCRSCRRFLIMPTSSGWSMKGGGNLAGRWRSCRKKSAKDSISKGETMKLKLACADFAFPLLPHDRVLDLIAMLEFEGVDIGLFEGRSHLWPSAEMK